MSQRLSPLATRAGVKRLRMFSLRENLRFRAEYLAFVWSPSLQVVETKRFASDCRRQNKIFGSPVMLFQKIQSKVLHMIVLRILRKVLFLLHHSVDLFIFNRLQLTDLVGGSFLNYPRLSSPLDHA